MNKLRKNILALTVCLLTIIACIPTASAHEAIDLTREDGTLAISMHYNKRPLPGGSLSLYHVGEIVEENGILRYRWLPQLHCKESLDQLNERTAAAAASCVKTQKIPKMTASVSAKGIASFSSLKTGLYLAVQETPANGFQPIKPFLISLPQWDGEHYVYQVTAAAKNEPQRIPKPNKPNIPVGPSLPQTGQLQWPIPILLVGGSALIATGLLLRKRKDHV